MAKSTSVKYGDAASSYTRSGDETLVALKRLDRLLERAVQAAHQIYGTEVGADPFRGLHIGAGDVECMLAREPGTPTLWTGQEPGAPSPESSAAEGYTLSWLKDAFGLSGFDMDVLLIALAPEIDLRYERLYAYLQDDVTRRRPTVDVALNLLCPTAEAKLARRAHFDSNAPLIRNRLLHLSADPSQVQPPLLTHNLKLDDQIIRFLLGEEALDARLATSCKLIEPATSLSQTPLMGEMMQALPTLVTHAWETQQPLRLYFHGQRGAGKRRTAEALAGAVGASLLTVDLAHVLAQTQNFETTLKLLFREAWFLNAFLYLDGLDALTRDEKAILSYRSVLEALADDSGVTILSSLTPWVSCAGEPTGVIRVSFPIPDVAQRRNDWRSNLKTVGVTADEHDLEALAGRFRLTPGQIESAVGMAHSQAQVRLASHAVGEQPGSQRAKPSMEELFSAARAQSGQVLGELAQKISPIYHWGDIVLPKDAVAQLRELCQRVTHRHRVLDAWGFDRKLSLGKGVNALFAGSAGTGKTMAAEIIASELQLDMYKINLSGIVSKYIGETEKNLDRIFTSAENANAILFFDEADALFGKRSEVHDSHDRYANIEISYLLQKMEQYEGVTLLATNLRSNLDEAFMRRLAFTVHFPFPDEASRRRIWSGIWPAETPLAQDVDLDHLAGRFKLTGGNIKNVALAAAFLAAEDGGPVSMAHLLHATGREFQKMGKVLSEDELGGSTGKSPSGQPALQ